MRITNNLRFFRTYIFRYNFKQKECLEQFKSGLTSTFNVLILRICNKELFSSAR